MGVRVHMAAVGAFESRCELGDDCPNEPSLLGCAVVTAAEGRTALWVCCACSEHEKALHALVDDMTGGRVSAALGHGLN